MPVRTHLITEGLRLTKCGQLDQMKTTDLLGDVTCGNCNPALRPPGKKVHFSLGDRTVCNRVGQKRTEKWARVTCQVCLLSRDRKKLKRVMRDRNDHYGDDTFKGLGRLCCRLCGRPYVEHPRPRPCEFVQGRVA